MENSFEKKISFIKQKMQNSSNLVPQELLDLALNTLRPIFKSKLIKSPPKTLPDIALGNNFVYSAEFPMIKNKDGTYKGPLVQINMTKLNEVHKIWEKNYVLQIFINNPCEDLWGQGLDFNDSEINDDGLIFRYIEAETAKNLWKHGSISKDLDIVKPCQDLGLCEDKQMSLGLKWEVEPDFLFHQNLGLHSFDFFQIDDEIFCDFFEYGYELSEAIHAFYQSLKCEIKNTVSDVELIENQDSLVSPLLHVWPKSDFSLHLFDLSSLIIKAEASKNFIPVFNFHGPCHGDGVDKYSIFIDHSKSFKDGSKKGKIRVLSDRYY